ncbi:DNA-binding response regulator, NarL/FixJ family, contains REC and HTH domains [Actinokineospora alba]|uniref:DNA-binding response regulator, NarL/FixJ family, contains REC and HTH domains n=1 Tax=Actinokineospora alba TaxID=504798 RepID=A0A1H0TV50_9PSEU|nr:response regulator transcription factor [Actinokineospora alba]TDP70739.1 LuxR family two component transcriptional regulator [Actinokineospora alba]SDJ14951.1 DNA-binding response regulator, NarL/FixJ family, contains REC and HTH domains [Actinokineospora alba]SDP57927.1 DNA-binding response regulator, NarL/FixJ family, contains REC and HTH domains [Actinokineospora alba]
MTIRIMVVDDHPVVRDGVSLLLRSDPAMQLVGAAESGRTAIERIAELAPDLVLLDLRMPDMLAPEVITELRKVHPSARIVVFTAHSDHQGLRAALEAGANGCLLKDVAGTDLVSALRRVLRDERVIDPRILPSADVQSDALARSGLTRREYEVLRLAAQGQTNPEIAESTGLTRNTVKTYLQAALHKLGARNRVEAISKASEAGLL